MTKRTILQFVAALAMLPVSAVTAQDIDDNTEKYCRFFTDVLAGASPEEVERATRVDGSFSHDADDGEVWTYFWSDAPLIGVEVWFAEMGAWGVQPWGFEPSIGYWDCAEVFKKKRRVIWYP